MGQFEGALEVGNWFKQGMKDGPTRRTPASQGQSSGASPVASPGQALQQAQAQGQAAGAAASDASRNAGHPNNTTIARDFPGDAPGQNPYIERQNPFEQKNQGFAQQFPFGGQQQMQQRPPPGETLGAKGNMATALQPGEQAGIRPGAGYANATGGGGGAPGGAFASTNPGAILSDERSKRKISELQTRLDAAHSAINGARPDYPTLSSPNTSALDDAYRRATANTYEYKDPSVPGAAPGVHAGPMAHELKPIPGVVSRGADGYDRVNTGRLSLANASQIGQQRRELDELQQRLAAYGDDNDAVLDTAAGRR